MAVPMWRDTWGMSSGYTGGSSAWGYGANGAQYTPVTVPWDVVCNGVMFDCTGGTSAGRNYDVGFYDADTLALLSSSGATLLVSGLNTWACAQPLTAGKRYYLGLSLSNATPTLFRLAPTAATQGRLMGLASQGSAHPLPSTMTPAQITSAYAVLFGLTFADG